MTILIMIISVMSSFCPVGNIVYKSIVSRSVALEADWRECHRQVVAQRLLEDFGAPQAEQG